MAIHFTEEEKEEMEKNPSEIYKKRTEETNKKDIENLSRRGKWQHFKEYYLGITVICILITAFVLTHIVKGAVRQPSHAIFIAIQKDVLDEGMVASFKTSLEKHMNLDTDKEVAFYKDYDEKYRFRTKYITGQDVLDNKETFKTEEGSDQTDYNCGLYLTESEKCVQIKSVLEKPVIGIARTTKRLEEAQDFVQYMMDNGQKMELEIQTAVPGQNDF